MSLDTKKQISEAIEVHKKMVTELQAKGLESIAAAAEMIIESLNKNGCVYICGNGGSAADAQHIAGELVGRFIRDRKGLAAVAMSTDTSVITSVANDYGYDSIFARQVEALVGDKDILWAISTSGNSANIIAAAKLAKEKNAKVLAFTGRAGSELEKIADVCFCAENKLTARSQEMHQLAYHIICDLVEESFCK
ncbi:MAG: D-sedoheptulose-7-phosphate isomerase [Planctomycetota bacterium]|jgi:D-sedoheptulose 7-phosphate isomerase